MSFVLKRVLPPAWISPLKRMTMTAKLAALRAVSRSDFLCSVYYGIVSTAFRREHRAVIAGLVRHHARQYNSGKFFLLRRNIHRIEKALLMRPRRTVFALDYIGETVDCFRECERVASVAERDTVLKWAADVLRVYFSTAGQHRVVARARTTFEATLPEQQDSSQRVPHRRALHETPVRYEDLLALAIRRRSVRWFLQKRPPRDLIDKALAVATQAPSACNRQPFHFHIYDDQDAVSEIAKLPLGTAGFRDNIPAIAVVVGDLSAYFGERDRHGIYVDASLAIMAFMLALETLGLSSCPLNWPDIGSLELRMSRLLALSPHERVIMLIAIGYPDPDGMVAYSQRRDLSEMRFYNRPD